MTYLSIYVIYGIYMIESVSYGCTGLLLGSIHYDIFSMIYGDLLFQQDLGYGRYWIFFPKRLLMMMAMNQGQGCFQRRRSTSVCPAWEVWDSVLICLLMALVVMVTVIVMVMMTHVLLVTTAATSTF